MAEIIQNLMRARTERERNSILQLLSLLLQLEDPSVANIKCILRKKHQDLELRTGKIELDENVPLRGGPAVVFNRERCYNVQSVRKDNDYYLKIPGRRVEKFWKYIQIELD